METLGGNCHGGRTFVNGNNTLIKEQSYSSLGIITANKGSGDDGIPVELFQILKDNAVKVLHSICQQIWKIQQWPQYWMLGARALGRPRGMVWGGRREEGSGWGTHVYLWWIHFDIWQN